MKTCYSILRAQYPNAVLKIPDKDYNKPTREFLWNELISSYIEDYKYLVNTTDCDDYALFLHAWIRQQQYKEKWGKPLAFGEAWSLNHALNIAVLDTDRVILVKSQTDCFRPPTDYDILFVRM